MPHLYFLEAQGLGAFKIGITSAPVAERIKALQTGCPAPIVIVASCPFDDISEAAWWERELHQAFGEFRTSGEWFALDAKTVGLAAGTVRRFWLTDALARCAYEATGWPVVIGCNDELPRREFFVFPDFRGYEPDELPEPVTRFGKEWDAVGHGQESAEAAVAMYLTYWLRSVPWEDDVKVAGAAVHNPEESVRGTLAVLARLERLNKERAAEADEFRVTVIEPLELPPLLP